MITGLHAMFYSTDAEATRAFIREKLGFPHFEATPDWPIFTPPESELGCHPSEKQFHEMTFYCDDIETTVAELTGRGVEFEGGITDAGFGLVTNMLVPGVGEVGLYQAKYKQP